MANLEFKLTLRFLMFFKELSSVHQTCIYLIQSTANQYNFYIFLLYKITVLYLNIYKNLIYCDFKAIFLASLLKSHNPSEISLICSFAAKKNIYYDVGNS